MNQINEQRTSAIWYWLRGIGTLTSCAAILGASVYAVILINQTEPTAQKIDRVRKSAALVETVTVQRGDFAPRLVVLGSVRPAQDISLSPRVGGQVVEISPGFIPGGMVRKGELLLRIDPADFENQVSIRKSELAQVNASREIEQARQRLAKKELQMLEGSIGETNRALVMREPQIASIEAEVDAAEASVERARLDLQRTRVIAPFDAQVLSRSVNVGSQVGAGDDLGRLVGVGEYWVIASVPIRNLRWIQFPEMDRQEILPDPDSEAAQSKPESQPDPHPSGIDPDDDHVGSSVVLKNDDAWGPGVHRQAHVSGMLGTLDQQTRMARVLITVNDPLGLENDAPPLILESLVELEIEGVPISDVIRLSREYVRDQDTVWVMHDGKLQIRDVEIEFRDAEFAYIRSGLEDGEVVVTTTLATVAEGVGLRRVETAAVESTQTLEPERADSDG